MLSKDPIMALSLSSTYLVARAKRIGTKLDMHEIHHARRITSRDSVVAARRT